MLETKKNDLAYVGDQKKLPNAGFAWLGFNNTKMQNFRTTTKNGV